jgi:hypothetical protein
MSLRELPEAACPLLKNSPQLRERFNTLAGELNEVEAGDPEFFARKDVRAMAEEASGLRELLARPRYLVGFLGLFQVGKSTTVNRVLRADADNRPAFEGQTGSATTATVTRVRSAPTGTHAITLRYLTRAGYLDRRDGLVKKLAERCSIRATEIDESALSAQLPGLIEDAKRTPDPFLPKNLEFLQRLVNGHRRFSREVIREDESLEMPGKPYARRWAYINHSNTQADDPSAPLLRDVYIDFVTDVVPREVELIDMPGLGVGWVIDNLLTNDLLKQVNGAMLFYNASENLDNETLADVLIQLHKTFPDGLRNRVWVVLTKCDALTRAHFTPGDKNIFTGISTFLERRRLSPDQVVFVCNKWDGKSPEQIAEQVRDLADTDDLHAKFPEHSELVKNFLALKQNGGIDRLRNLITHDVAVAVEQETRREVERRLLALEDQLRTARQLREEETRFDPNRQANLFQVLSALSRVLGHVDRRTHLLDPGEGLRDYFSEPAKAARQSLVDVLDRIYPQGNVLRGMTVVQVGGLFPSHAHMLEERLTAILTNEMLPEVFRRVGEEFVSLPDVPVVSCPHGVRARWEEWANSDRRDRSWRLALNFPSFLDPDRALFGLASAQAKAALNGLSYREMMLEKVRRVTQQSAHALRVRVRQHLLALEQAYREALETQNVLARATP